MATPAVEYRDVSYAYPARGDSGSPRPVLEHVTLTVNEGERLGVLGPNGGGKSTLLKLTLGLLRGASGEIRVFGLSPDRAVREGLVGYVPQRPDCELAFPISARQVVEMGPALALPAWKRLSADHRAAVERGLHVVGASSFADRPIGHLSGGQFQRVMIARALAASPRLLLLDEPTVGIDVSGQQQFADLLKRLHDELKLTVIVVSHDIRTVAAGCDRIACLSRTLHSHVAPEGLTPAVLAEVFRHDVAGIFGEVHVDAHAAAACKDPSHHHHPGGGH
ncbi:Manganese transport system ATP-binding protein MntB [Phycisphaerales bacterium]|nr:Manganese transport system ATP-binding protein MntB [Phycisphaerales bacterium]